MTFCIYLKRSLWRGNDSNRDQTSIRKMFWYYLYCTWFTSYLFDCKAIDNRVSKLIVFILQTSKYKLAHFMFPHCSALRTYYLTSEIKQRWGLHSTWQYNRKGCREGFRIVCKIFWKRHFIRHIRLAVRLIVRARLRASHHH